MTTMILTDVTDTQVAVIVDGDRRAMTWAALNEAADQTGDRDLARIYTELRSAARERQAKERAKKEADALAARIAACPGHRPVETFERAYTGGVSRDENRAAHGGICLIHMCSCGAEQRENVNGRHVETGPWH